jgi:uncharacterized protein YegL
MNKQFYEELLAKFQKANKERKLYLANKAGYDNIDDYKKALEASVTGSVTTAPTVIPVIHNVHILDISGSMSGEKLRNAIKGINAELEELKKDVTVTYKQTIVTFGNYINIIHSNEPIHNVPRINVSSGGMTALYQAIGETIEDILKTNTGEKVLIKIFTDGEENSSRGKFRSPQAVSKIIKEAEDNNCTVTFVGTQQDVDSIIRQLSIDSTNTLVHNNTGEGVEEAFSRSLGATRSYSKKVLAGEDVLKGFYKTTETL